MVHAFARAAMVNGEAKVKVKVKVNLPLQIIILSWREVAKIWREDRRGKLWREKP